jgi:tetratricopeptide (TPR) repeat protein
MRGPRDGAAALRGSRCRAPQDFQPKAQQAELLRHLGRYDEAREVYRGVLELDPANYAATLGLGLAARAALLHPEAETWFRRAMLLDPKAPAARLELATTLREQGDTVGGPGSDSARPGSRPLE